MSRRSYSFPISMGSATGCVRWPHHSLWRCSMRVFHAVEEPFPVQSLLKPERIDWRLASTRSDCRRWPSLEPSMLSKRLTS